MNTGFFDRLAVMRAIGRCSIRAIGLVLLLYGIYLVIVRIVSAGIYADGIAASFAHALRYRPGVGQENGIARRLPMIIVDTVLTAGSRRLSRWPVAMHDTGCPNCGYPTASPVCLGCGMGKREEKTNKRR